MLPILQYILKLSISLSVVYLFYQVVLRRLTFYNWNRWYLVLYSLVSFLIPFVNISLIINDQQIDNSPILQWVPAIGTYSSTIIAQPVSTGLSAAFIIKAVLIAGMGVMLLRLLVQLFSFRKMLKKARLIPADGINLFQVNEKIIPFSFGNSIFINRSLHNEQELQEIILHEFVHVKQKHSIDIIFSELLCLFNWFNPFAWLIRKSIRQNLEFIADNEVLQNGIDRRQYQYLLLKVIGNNHFSIASKFNFSSLKKRIAMMNKMKSAGVHLVKFLFILPLVAVLLVAFRNEYGEQFQPGKPANLKSLQPGVAAVVFTDTVPSVRTANSKGYYIDIKGVNGECTVVVKDEKGKEVETVLLIEWKDKADMFEEKYGEILPPPAPLYPTMVAPTSPTPPTPPTIPSGLTAPTPPTPPTPPSAPTKCCADCPEADRLSPSTVMGYGGHLGGQTVLSPLAPLAAGINNGVMIVDGYSSTITGKEDVLVKIIRNTTREDLDQFKTIMKEKGIELVFDDIEYNEKGKLVQISGHMKSKDGISNFSANDFECLILAMVKNENQTYFKVSTQDSKEVI